MTIHYKWTQIPSISTICNESFTNEHIRTNTILFHTTDFGKVQIFLYERKREIFYWYSKMISFLEDVGERGRSFHERFSHLDKTWIGSGGSHSLQFWLQETPTVPFYFFDSWKWITTESSNIWNAVSKVLSSRWREICQ